MDAVTISRRIAKLEYAAVRRPFAFFDDRLLGRYWNEDAIVRSGFGRFLGSLDRVVGWLLADETISQRGRDLMGRTGGATDVWEEAAAQEPVSREPISQARTVDVTFTLPGEVGAGNVALCGDFNNWSAGSIALQRGSDGAWQVTLPLEAGRSYRYRYLLDGERWENAWQADWYEPNPFGSTNSVVNVDWPERALELAA